ncbi:DUF3048 domain-containing protein [Paenibacillus sp. 1P07SE]|uniref:DUF3048 domain-containing protein n=1 Tax=Paenibacillus sp. 1P07SE TaxID=3132209 RepID=UPI0039A59D64
MKLNKPRSADGSATWKRRITVYRAGLAMLALLLLAACSTNEALETVPPAPPALEEPVVTEPEPEPEPTGFRAPLTGLLQEEEATLRPIAVMINNNGPARPQSGLTGADVIWEVLAEGGITRLVAIYQSQSFPEAIGPIRSIRPYLIELGESYQAVLAHAGGSPEAYSILQRQAKPYLDEIGNAGSFFWRESFRKAPHNLYSNLEKLREGAERRNYKTEVPIPVMRFLDKDELVIGDAATEIEISFLLKSYKVSYSYDETSGQYLRSINDSPHTDMNNDQQLSAANLVVLGTSHRTLDSEGRLAVDLTSGGPAVVFRQGTAVEAEWERRGDDAIRIMKDGSELAFAPGKTYYHIVPMTPTFADHLLY